MARIDVQCVKRPYAFHHVSNRIPYCVLVNSKVAIEAYRHAELYGMDHGFRERYYQE
jgi:hypothetical protein